MRIVSPETTAAWEAVYKGGSRRATTRATISRLFAHTSTYERGLAAMVGSLRGDRGVWRSALFNQADQPVELPNLATCTISRSVDQDAATCVLELWNTRVLPIGEVPTDSDLGTELDVPGWYSPFRGTTTESTTRWDHVPNGWRDVIIPDRIIRTYQGYGVNPSVIPELDANLYLTGVWMIDDVELTADRTIKVNCRDLVRILMDIITLPPTIPWSAYPLQWEAYREVDNPDQVSKSQETSWFRPKYQTDSNIPYIGRGFTDGGRAYVSSDGGVLGHKGAHAFDKDKNTYWLSVGNYPSWSSAYEYVQGSFSARTISAVRVHLWGGPYKIYVSVKANGVWQGATKIPYRSRAVDTGADINFVRRVPRDKVSKNGIVEIKLPKAIANATAVRITFSDLMDTGIGTFRYRAGCRSIQVLGATTVTTTTDGGTHTEGNYGDYTDIVKMLCAWGGLHWPKVAKLRRTDDAEVDMSPATDDPVLVTGRVWGDFMSTGTAGVSVLDSTSWDKIPLMDGISQIRDIVGFNFFVDEHGGAVWRLPNVYSVGNYVCGAEGGPYSATRSTDLVEIEDDRHLLKGSVKLSSRNVRDMVIVTNVAGNYGGAAAGWNPAPTGFDRVGGWTDQRFTSEEECQLMADLITLRQLFEYHKSPITIPAHPGIQVDDQVRLYERTTSNTYVHYVRGYSTTWEAVTGRWTQDLDIHWLGETPFTQWAFSKEKLANYTRQYLLNLVGDQEVDL